VLISCTLLMMLFCVVETVSNSYMSITATGFTEYWDICTEQHISHCNLIYPCIICLGFNVLQMKRH